MYRATIKKINNLNKLPRASERSPSCWMRQTRRVSLREKRPFSVIVTHAEQKALFVTFRMEVSDSRRLMVMWSSLSIAVQAFRDYREKNKKIETFRFWDENNYEYQIWLKVFSRILKSWTPRKASLHFFSTKKISTVIFNKRALAISRRQNDKTSNTLKLVSFRHHDILAKTLGGMTTAIVFPAKMTLVYARALLCIEKISYS